jgi:hypothetical protein
VISGSTLNKLSATNAEAPIPAAALLLIENMCSLVVIEHGLKIPRTNGTGGMITLKEYDPSTEQVFEGIHPPNLGIELHPKGGSQIITLDQDQPEPLPQLRELGVSRSEATWRWRTGRDGLGVAYRWLGDPLPRVIRAGGFALDLLANGYVIVPPSNTYLFADDRGRGGPYRWIEGHSPIDIPITELEEPTAALIEWWKAQSKRPTNNVPNADRQSGQPSRAWRLITGAIPDGQRNDSLARIAGWLRQYHPEPVVSALLAVVNEARCDPPLSVEEVAGIAASICRYPQSGVNGHPKAVVNPWREDEA